MSRGKRKSKIHLPAEIFGFSVDNTTAEAEKCREKRWCPFLGRECEKTEHVKREEGKKEKVRVGTCTVWHEDKVHVICPARFLENDKKVLRDAAGIVFDDIQDVEFVPEVQIPTGRIDWIAVKVDDSGVKDFAGIELMANQTTDTKHLVEAVEDYMRSKKFGKQYYKYGVNTLNQIKTFMYQCLSKGWYFNKWNKKYLWIFQDALFDEYVKRWDISLKEMPKDGENLIFLVYELLYNSESKRYNLRKKEVWFLSYEDFRKAMPKAEELAEEEFKRKLKDKVQQTQDDPRPRMIQKSLVDFNLRS